MKPTSKAKATTTKPTTSAPVTPSRPTTGKTAVVQVSASPTKSASRPVSTETIAARAYTLWEKAGRPQGRDLGYWLQAESEIKQGSKSVSA